MSKLNNLPVLLTVPYWKFNNNCKCYVHELDKYVEYHELGDIVKEFGYTEKSYFLRWVFGIILQSEVDKCDFIDPISYRIADYLLDYDMKFHKRGEWKILFDKYKVINGIKVYEVEGYFEYYDVERGRYRSKEYFVPWTNEWVPNRNMKWYLSNINKTGQQWYNRFRLNKDENFVPKCENCGEPLWFKKISHGYGNSCYNDSSHLFCSNSCKNEYYLRSGELYNDKSYISIKFGKIYYKSKYELNFIKSCEENDSIIDLKFEPFYIEYQPDCELVRKYYPDFLVYYKDGTRELVEIKSYFSINDPTVPFKFEAAEKFCKEHNIKWTVYVGEDFELVNR